MSAFCDARDTVAKRAVGQVQTHVRVGAGLVPFRCRGMEVLYTGPYALTERELPATSDYFPTVGQCRWPGSAQVRERPAGTPRSRIPPHISPCIPLPLIFSVMITGSRCVGTLARDIGPQPRADADRCRRYGCRGDPGHGISLGEVATSPVRSKVCGWMYGDGTRREYTRYNHSDSGQAFTSQCPNVRTTCTTHTHN